MSRIQMIFAGAVVFGMALGNFGGYSLANMWHGKQTTSRGIRSSDDGGSFGWFGGGRSSGGGYSYHK
ncbi:hypothetical protein [Labrys sp. ZIDIC5]|uniref:hypothetical protein n=1 Tax=Labrys sedimenti TaxID=3106036 RepID=UPI002AC9F736|nr:hypothetical protein [Labrys sp. ZIDIC5]MDZ5449691.1 hypothetical protein [Labrys sp. ZIDIC5]